MNSLLKKVLVGLLLGSSLMAQAASPIRVAVTDLAYEERVREYFRSASASEKSSYRGSGSESDYDSDHHSSHRYKGSVNAKSESSYSYSEGTYSYIERGELRKFTADIKGEMVKSGAFQLIQSKPYTAKNTEELYDVIARIKKGLYKGADYVLFGSVDSIEFLQEANPIDHTDTVSYSLALELVAEFSLISTKNYQVIASFSATGSGQDVKMLSSRGGRVKLNRGRVISEVSKSLGKDVIQQLEEQLGSMGGSDVSSREIIREERSKDEVIIFR